MEIKVLARSLVKPAELSHRKFVRLSNLDQIMGPSHTSMLLFFRNAAMPSSGLQASLRRLLVEFHPLAGRFRLQDDGKAYIECTDEGIEFSEAYANGEVCEVEQPCKEYELLDPYRRQVHKPFCDIPPMLIQVTRFRCGGVGLCLTASHKIFDGHSFALFLALGIQQRSEPAIFGYPRLMNTTVAIADGMKKKYHFPVDSERQGPGPNVACKLFSFSRADIQLLKSRTQERSFRSLAVHVWSCITKARCLPLGSETKLAFAVNARKRFSPSILDTVVGNVISSALASCTAEQLLNGHPAAAARLITDALLQINNEYMPSIIDLVELGKYKLPIPGFDGFHTDVLITSLVDMPLVDLGWGAASSFVPAFTPSHSMCTCYFLQVQGSGVNVLVRGLTTEEMDRLEDNLHPLTD